MEPDRFVQLFKEVLPHLRSPKRKRWELVKVEICMIGLDWLTHNKDTRHQAWKFGRSKGAIKAARLMFLDSVLLAYGPVSFFFLVQSVATASRYAIPPQCAGIIPTFVANF